MKKIFISLVTVVLFMISMVTPMEANASGSGYSGKTIRISHYTQETGYYCGPAALKSALTSFGNYSHSQGTLASWMGTSSAYGTSGAEIKRQLNNLGTKSDWYMISYPSVNYSDTNDLWNKVYANVGKRSYPVVVGIHGIFPGFTYPVRHFVTIYGYTGSNAQNMTYHYVDPAGGRNHNIKWGSMKADRMAYFVADGSIIW
ncbi:C39 family peptidase [Listeria monocytogenes]|uniref:C39 family peptidase n=1 Tax=Listeria monocytogenes TaxID=1639 RepID=UPI0007756ADF|nr:C39 family peptidase [Listeria monocytogenes]KXS60530.1 hypothetical protein AWJ01_05680 [Listeria monocytogenes]